MDLEKTLEGLDCCKSLSSLKCIQCPYYPDCNKGDKMDALLSDALEALKAREARVMTLEEVARWNTQATHVREPVYIENIHEPHYTWAFVGNFARYSSHKAYSFDGYGISWRCWTFRPTDKQREETPWE